MFEKESGMELVCVCVCVVGSVTNKKEEGGIRIKGYQVALTRDPIHQIYINEILFCLSVFTAHEMPG